LKKNPKNHLFFFLRWKPSKKRMVVKKLIKMKIKIKMKVFNHYTKIFCLHQNMWFLWYYKFSSYVMLMSKNLKGYFLVGYHSWCTFKFVQMVLMVKNFVNFWFCNEMQTQDTFFDSQQRKGHKSSMMKLKQAFKLSSLSCQTIRTNKKRWLMFVTKMVYRQATS